MRVDCTELGQEEADIGVILGGGGAYGIKSLLHVRGQSEQPTDDITLRTGHFADMGL